jgi:hypothetical protein
MRTSLLIFLCVLGLETGSAQVTAQDHEIRRIDRNVFGMGFSAGMASGFGLSFRHHLPGETSYQLVGGIIKLGENLDYNIGGELQFDFARSPTGRFFAAGAGGYFYSGTSSRNDLSASFRAGLGIGGEWSSGSPLNLGAELLFTYFSDGTVIPLPQFSAHYYFF